jgi:hypothetical protein
VKNTEFSFPTRGNSCYPQPNNNQAPLCVPLGKHNKGSPPAQKEKRKILLQRSNLSLSRFSRSITRIRKVAYTPERANQSSSGTRVVNCARNCTLNPLLRNTRFSTSPLGEFTSGILFFLTLSIASIKEKEEKPRPLPLLRPKVLSPAITSRNK